MPGLQVEFQTSELTVEFTESVAAGLPGPIKAVPVGDTFTVQSDPGRQLFFDTGIPIRDVASDGVYLIQVRTSDRRFSTTEEIIGHTLLNLPAKGVGDTAISGDQAVFSRISSIHLASTAGRTLMLASADMPVREAGVTITLYELEGAQGPAGPRGADSAVPGPAGPSLNFRDAWSAGATYAMLDVVLHGGSSWVSLFDNNTGNEPAPDSPQWGLLAERGGKGDRGEQGEQGVPGTAEVADDSITTAKLADDAVTQAKLADDAVGGRELRAAVVATGHIADNAVTGNKIASETIVARNIAADQIGDSELAGNSVGSIHLKAGAVTNAKLNDGSVSENKLAAAVRTKLNAPGGQDDTARDAAEQARRQAASNTDRILVLEQEPSPKRHASVPTPLPPPYSRFVLTADSRWHASNEEDHLGSFVPKGLGASAIGFNLISAAGLPNLSPTGDRAGISAEPIFGATRIAAMWQISGQPFVLFAIPQALAPAIKAPMEPHLLHLRLAGQGTLAYRLRAYPTTPFATAGGTRYNIWQTVDMDDLSAPAGPGPAFTNASGNNNPVIAYVEWPPEAGETDRRFLEASGVTSGDVTLTPGQYSVDPGGTHLLRVPDTFPRRFEDPVSASPATLPAGTHTLVIEGTHGGVRHSRHLRVAAQTAATTKWAVESANVDTPNISRDAYFDASYEAGTRTLTYAFSGAALSNRVITAIGEA